ncbi:MAG TPA: M48 family metalloprotease [Rhodocyclaceae bacterium]|nr:M48 family metalloprotease [Rhodocyclaceae bacterium]
MRPLFELSLLRAAAILAGALLAGGCSTTAIIDSAKSFGRSVADTAKSATGSVTDTAKGGVAKVADAATIKPISPEQEAKIGLSAAAMLLGAAPLVRDDALQKYVNQVGRWVAVQTGRTDIEWRFGVIDTPNINAFAAPSGYVFITDGLFRKLRNESELAGALGHEIAHVTRRHHAIAIAKKDRLGAVANLAGDAAGTVTLGLGKALVDAVGNLVKGVYSAGLDKGDEYEADRLGVVYAARAGYHPYGLPRVLMTIAELPPDAGLELLFATHPLPTARLAALDEAMEDKLIKLEASGIDNTSVFKRLLAASPEQRKSKLPPAVLLIKTKEGAPVAAAATPAPEPEAARQEPANKAPDPGLPAVAPSTAPAPEMVPGVAPKNAPVTAPVADPR